MDVITSTAPLAVASDAVVIITTHQRVGSNIQLHDRQTIFAVFGA
jgi:hypothetical protein